MSYIDCFKHELLGYFNGLPINHPLEKIIGDGWGQYDFSATPENLILGGGSGEHPALVLHNLPALVAQYLLLAIENTENNFPEYKISISSKIIDAVTDIRYTKFELEFCAWSMVDMIVCPPPNYIKTRKESLSAKYWQEVGYFGWNYIRS
ncbi:MAG: hypothetical protein ACMZI2_04110 [Candidatus Symbiodolus clandestinus]